MVWCISAFGLIAITGLSVDFTRASTAQRALQDAADAAALTAERMSDLPFADRRAAAEQIFRLSVLRLEEGEKAVLALSELPDGMGHKARASLPLSVTFSRLLGEGPLEVAATSIADESTGPVEVALALDNTGSMRSDMDALRSAAHDLVDAIYAADKTGENVHVGIVPFVAQVNIGADPGRDAWLDRAGTAPYNGELFEDRLIATRAAKNNACNFSDIPNSDYKGPYRIVWIRSGSTCYAFNPGVINYFDLYEQLSKVTGAAWKGCVEARPEPYDITDAPPTSSNPSTMFVPYFWMDTLDKEFNSNNTTSNDYLDDDDGAVSGATMYVTSSKQRGYMFNVFKYGGSGSVSTSAPDVGGPNRGCPTPILPLTDDRDDVEDAIDAMRDWNGGGTNQIEGLAWAWRVLSPAAPFTQGAPYGEKRKVLVLMTDGENTNVGSDPIMGSDYSSLSHRNQWLTGSSGFADGDKHGGVWYGALPTGTRRDIDSSAEFVSYIDAREKLLCENIKAAGIEVFTVAFRTPSTTVATLLKDCASSGPQGDKRFYYAANGTELQTAFKAIGAEIGRLRLTQ